MSLPVITTFTLGPYETNCFVVTAGSNECWIVDCGFDPQEMLDFVQSQRLKPIAILLTHAHVDHIAGVDMALARLGRLPLYLHDSERSFCSDPMLNLSGFAGMEVTCTEPDHDLKDGNVLELNGSTWRAVHTPGHSPGGMCFINDESKQAIVGDTLFAGSIGRYDFPTSDVKLLRRSIHDVIMTWPDDYTIYPGHGPSTTIGEERRTNPYVIGGF